MYGIPWVLVMMTTDQAQSAQILAPTASNIELCAQALKAGQLVAFPTETVFGLGAVVTQLQAVQGIFAAKGRPNEHPLIAHVAPGIDLGPWVGQGGPHMQKLIDAFWPGPLTLVVPKGDHMPSSVTGGQTSVGIRCPSHPVAVALLKAVGSPVAAPSANRFGKVSPTRALHVLAELGNRIPYILDGEMPSVGIESTIVSLLGPQPGILRPGAVSAAQIEAVLGVAVKTHAQVKSSGTQLPRVSGALEKHYSPDAKVTVLSADQLAASKLSGNLLCVGWSDAFLTYANKQRTACSSLQIEALSNDPVHVARDLYATLRQADALGCTGVLFEAPPEGAPAWEAVADRLKRAAA